MMDRLTAWKDDKNLLAKAKFSGDFGSQNILQSLAEYEDLEELIGIHLKEIAEIFSQNIPKDCKNPRKAIVLTDDDVDRWNGYKNAEEQGLLLRLPCKVGSTVYHIANKRILEVENIDVFFLCLCVAECRFGKTVFLTQAEAEQKLKEMESD